MTVQDVIIIGGGPSGLTAGLYASRAGLKTLLLERGVFGGQMVNAKVVENYPGYPEGIGGFDLGLLMQQQAERYGLETAVAEVTGVETGRPNRIFAADGEFEGWTIIIAAGSEYSRLDVPGEERLLGRGVSYCATCDGFLFRDRIVAVVGGGDTAITDAIELSEYTRRVYVIHRRDELRAGQVLQERVFSQPRIEVVWDSVVDEIAGEDKVSALSLRNVKTGQITSLEVDGVFVAVGLKPNTQCFADLVQLDDARQIVTNGLMSTSAAGIFAAGDIRSNSPRQIASAVGDGVTAAMSAMKYLRGH